MRLPEWFKTKGPSSADSIHQLKRDLRRSGLFTVCEEAKCPNKGECFSRGTATFMIMGDVCTRNCGFCAVKTGAPAALDTDEPIRIAGQVRAMNLKHAVVTSVTRDDLQDGGAAHFARTVEEIRKLCPDTTVEVLTPDFEGRGADIKTVCDAGPDVFNHNVETVERLTPIVRNRASYRRSLGVLKMVSHREEPTGRRGDPMEAGGLLRYARNDIKVKSGLMLGLGETEDEVVRTLKDLKDAGCDIVTVGQYLRPSFNSLPVAGYIHPDMFEKYRLIGEGIGIKHMFCGPRVRSSYMAERGLYGS